MRNLSLITRILVATGGIAETTDIRHPFGAKKGKQHCLLDINGGAQKGRRGNQDTANMGR